MITEIGNVIGRTVRAGFGTGLFRLINTQNRTFLPVKFNILYMRRDNLRNIPVWGKAQTNKKTKTVRRRESIKFH